MNDLSERFRDALVSVDRLQSAALFEQALAASRPIDAVEAVVVPALEQIGQAWERGELALSQVYMSGRLCEELVERSLPPSDPDRKHQPRSAVVALSDYHLLGKRIVYAVMRASGYEIFDFGRMDVDALVQRTLDERIRVLMISVLLLPSALKVREVCDQLRAAGAGTRVVVGGAPFLFDANLWREVGADAMGRNASDGVTIVGRWLEELA